MKIGLYSQIAREHVMKVRQEVASLGLGTSEADMREFRKLVADSNDVNHRLIRKSGDFFNLSMLRDLIFHVQEHQFTLPEIRNHLKELGLEFCGFEVENLDPHFEEFHGQGSDKYDLNLWHEFEKENTFAFIGMYQFWCQKL
jgi:hypothetical protein